MSKNKKISSIPQIGGINKIQSVYFCSECGNLYDITQNPKKLVHRIPEKNQNANVTNKYSESNKNNAFFICTTCGNTEPIKPQSLIFNKKSLELSKEYNNSFDHPKNLINVPLFLHTRDYICPNKSCQTHTQPQLRDAIISRIGNTFKMFYICSVCSTIWKNN